MATAPNWSDYGKGVPRYSATSINQFIRSPNSPSNAQSVAQIVSAFGSLDNYLSAAQKFEADQQKYLETFYKEEAQSIGQPENYFQGLLDANTESIQSRQESLQGAQDVLKYQITPEMQKQADRDPYYAAQLQNPDLVKLIVDDPDQALKLRQESRANGISSVRGQLEAQYNNLVSYDSRLAYQGRASDLPAIFNQQAAQLADAGVTNIGDLRVQDGRLVNSATGKVVTNSNLGGQVAVDRDTGVQKWGDILSGVKGGANYGIQALEDGSVVLFPAWEKTKSPIAQIGLGGLEQYITPILTVAGAYFGAPQLGGALGGAVGGAAGGAAIGNTAGQLLASGEIDWEQVALSGALAGAGQYVGGLLSGGEAAAAGGTGLTPGASEGFQAADWAASSTAGITPPAGFQLAPNLGASLGAAPSILGPSEIDLLGGTDFSKIGETGITGAPSTSGSVYDPFATAAPGVGEGIMVLPPSVPGGAATVAGLEAPGLSSMGGAQGITVPIQGGGVVNESIFIPPGATPSLGDPSSFINNPDYLGSPVISEDYVGLTSAAGAAEAAGGMTLTDALVGGALLAGGQPQPQPYQSGYGAGRQMAGVDASGLLALLQGRAGVPGVAGLLAPVVNPYSLLG